MLALDDVRWKQMTGGYKGPYDPRPALVLLESNGADETAWDELWSELHHQGDVGEASYAAVPHLVRIYRKHGRPDWNTYAIVATVELARDSSGNPPVPEWLAGGYRRALDDLAAVALAQLPDAADSETVRSMLAIVAIWKGARTYGHVLAELTEDEVQELEEQAFGGRA
jgi:hypothetical protein